MLGSRMFDSNTGHWTSLGLLAWRIVGRVRAPEMEAGADKAGGDSVGPDPSAASPWGHGTTVDGKAAGEREGKMPAPAGAEAGKSREETPKEGLLAHHAGSSETGLSAPTAVGSHAAGASI